MTGRIFKASSVARPTLDPTDLSEAIAAARRRAEREAAYAAGAKPEALDVGRNWFRLLMGVAVVAALSFLWLEAR